YFLMVFVGIPRRSRLVKRVALHRDQDALKCSLGQSLDWSWALQIVPTSSVPERRTWNYPLWISGKSS
ncbi:hypothetical protein, partial [Paracoccus haeundaensis]|uniref:hypothetical protein n=1 Tax=Paracoccus haeundaensis TaxID=225362 RepID=UPI001C400472